ncbi:MAG: Nif3-like dinuclear metal center hexameric protein [Gemmatimonadaceae bacterium]|nr:Nif3-like dinuclear metal center hexameric protein [Gemmatimonadaceae bacterium]
MIRLPLEVVTGWADAQLRTAEIPDYPPALNGLQLASASGTVTRVAAAVDGSRRAIEGAIAAGADLLLLHHGLFWGGNQRLVGAYYDRVALLMRHGIAVYASHLPLDLHPVLGNNARLAQQLGLVPSAGFGRFQTIQAGCQGAADVETAVLVSRASAFAEAHGGRVHHSVLEPGRRTRRWAIITGAGASSESLREAAAQGIDTLITGEGPHHTAVEAPELGIVVLYAGHYATETLGVTALAEAIGAEFGIPWSFVAAPTGT